MEIRLPIKLVEKAIDETSHVELIRAKDAMLKYGTSVARTAVVNGALLDKATLKFLYDETKDKDTQASNSIEFLYKALKNPSKIVVKSMKDVLVALKQYLTSAGIKNYVFERGSHKTLMPYLVTNIASPERSRYSSRYERNKIIEVNVSLAYDSGEQLETKTLHFGPSTLKAIFDSNKVKCEEREHTERKGSEEEYTYTYDCVSEKGVSVEALLRHYDKFLETTELHELLDKQLERYIAFIKQYGSQFRVRGVGDSTESSYWTSHDASMMVEGKPGRCIMNTVPQQLMSGDEQEAELRRSRNKRRGYWGGRNNNEEGNEDAGLSNDPLEIKALFEGLEADALGTNTKTFMTEDKAGVEVLAPLHPRLKVFHLTKMQDFWVHVNNLNPYKYKEDLIDKLVLEDEVKELVQMLVVNAADDMEDIIEGKTQSTIIGAVGDPGLGKTLMCEVMSEVCQKPLYKVQAAQLGLSPEELERNLNRILMQAQRWNAILMIDEANAYIHSRGHDIKQNAIVGVFLRLLDYYKGILVLTTNMTNKSEDAALDFDIDAAIINRCTAIIKFKLPDDALARELWKVQASMRGMELEKDLVNHLSKKYRVAGRTIRNLLKMAANWAEHRGEELNEEHFKKAAKYVPMSSQEQRTLIRDR